MRTEIQALRAVAVLAVVGYHLWPNRLPGGFVGVDVFFVVSGFLITDHLLREVATRNRVHLPTFWARRARRLLPASFVTIAATAAAVYLWVPENRWPQFGRELLASAFYVENWELSRQAVDYLAQSNVVSPSQHFWSLGVEEQFYLVWPVLIGAATLLAVRLRRRPDVVVAAALLLVFAASLAHSVDLTPSDPGRAYFSTLTRAWEFAAGGLLAWLGRRVALERVGGAGLRSAVSWGGFAAIGVSLLVIDGSTPFPGYAAGLPVLGTVAVILAGAPSSRLSPAPLMDRRPVQLLGDVSYGVYLWHWPLIVLLPYVTGADLGTTDKLGILLGSVLLGWLSKTLVEDRFRSPGPPTGGWTGPSRTFATVGAASAVLVVSCLALVTWTPAALPDAREVAATPCLGAKALLDPGCDGRIDDALVTEAAAFATDLAPADISACETSANSRTYRRCSFGSTDPAALGVALVGDSHATRIADAVRTTAESESWRLSTFLVSGCPMLAREWVGSTWGADATYSEICRTTAVRALDEVAADPTIDVVVVTNRTRLYLSEDPDLWPLTAAQVADVLTRLQQAGKAVVVLRDTPEMRGVPVEGGVGAVDCLLQTDDATDCSVPRAEIAFDDPLRTAGEMTGSPVVDLDDLVCDDARCFTQIGGIVVYTDDNHLTTTFARTAQPTIAARLTAAVEALGKDPS
ncbi:acyltransferase [Aeromicrobium marinum DSM 15272]|uniref:Acyltransferase n=1 Tax=Aeromicrobium marinum DSM 15272 TaxID=585531 RepID=E2SG25_9ACTN|nr:acyltransferase [Aeromicrobium marinum DSM 15272]